MSRTPHSLTRPNGALIFFLFLLTAGAVAGVGWLYLQDSPPPEMPPAGSATPFTVSPGDLGAIPQGADSSAHSLLARAVTEVLKPDSPHDESMTEGIKNALERILESLEDESGGETGRDKFEHSALFLTGLSYDKLQQFDGRLAPELRAGAESVCRRLAREKITEIADRHHNRLLSQPSVTLKEMQSALEALKGKITPLAPLLKNEEEENTVFSDLNDIIKFISERRGAKPGGQRITGDAGQNTDWIQPADEFEESSGAYEVQLKISEAIGRSPELPGEITLTFNGDRQIGKFPIPSEKIVWNAPIREKLELAIPETGETISFPSPGRKNLALLGMPGVIAGGSYTLADLDQSKIKVEIVQTYKLPPFLFDAVAQAESDPVPEQVRKFPAPVRSPGSPKN